MKFNFYQKVTITVFIVTLIAISIWFIPYRETIYTYDGKNYLDIPVKLTPYSGEADPLR